MKLFYFQSEQGNFGDDLNNWMWKELIPHRWGYENETFIAIGTVLNNLLPSGKKIVFGSGVGYAPLPENMDNFDVLCVRGPISAKLLGLEPSKSITDSAILIRSLDSVSQVSPTDRKGIAFMPHVSSAIDGNWEQVCNLAGIEYLDPRSDSKDLIKKIASAELVLAEAMHAAIVADAMRVPWIPCIATSEINTMKWLDWTLSMDVPYKPVVLPASSFLESGRDRFLKSQERGDALFLESADSNNQLHMPNDAEEQVVADYHHKFTKSKPIGLKLPQRIYKYYWRVMRILTSIKLNPVRILLVPLDKIKIKKSASALREASKLTPFLSDQNTCEKRTSQMFELLTK